MEIEIAASTAPAAIAAALPTSDSLASEINAPPRSTGSAGRSSDSKPSERPQGWV